MLQKILLEAAQTAAETTGGSDSVLNLLDSLMGFMLLACGVYALFTAFKLKHLCYLFPSSFLYPGDCKPNDCTDVPGFIDFMLPRLFLFGGAVLLLAAVFLVNMLVLHIDSVFFNIGYIVVPLALFGWYIFAQRKAAGRFW